MRRLKRIFNRIMHRLGIRPRSRPEDIPKKLDAQTLALVMKEACFLRFQHGVNVTDVPPGEEAELPKPADGSIIP